MAVKLISLILFCAISLICIVYIKWLNRFEKEKNDKELSTENDKESLKVKEEFEKDAIKHRELVEKYRKIFVDEIIKLIQDNFKQLKSKFIQNTYYDDYGNLIMDEFHKEVEYFFIKVLIPNLNNPLSIGEAEKLKESYNYFFNSYGYIRAQFEDGFAEKYLLRIENFYEFDLEISIKSKNTKETSYSKIELKKTIDHEAWRAFNHEAWINPYEYLISEDYYSNFDLQVQEIFKKCFNLLINIDKNPIKYNHNLKHKKEITPIDYEKQICLKLKEMGFNARTTKATGDQGTDVLAEKDGVSFAIQCKMYSKPVGNKAVQEANAGRDFYQKDYGVVVSNATFTKAARQAANACGIILLNENQLDELLKYKDK